MIKLTPSSTTSAPLTPIPLTRCSMICRAWSRDSREGGRPSTVRAVRVTRVPPCRSMPSLGLGRPPPVRNTSAYSRATIPAKIARLRQGRKRPAGGATVGGSPHSRRTAPGAGTGEVPYCASTATGPLSGAGIWCWDVDGAEMRERSGPAPVQSGAVGSSATVAGGGQRRAGVAVSDPLPDRRSQPCGAYSRSDLQVDRRLVRTIDDDRIQAGGSHHPVTVGQRALQPLRFGQRPLLPASIQDQWHREYEDQQQRQEQGVHGSPITIGVAAPSVPGHATGGRTRRHAERWMGRMAQGPPLMGLSVRLSSPDADLWALCRNQNSQLPER